MKIAQQLPQFKKERALLILTGTQEAEFYVAGDGNTERIEAFRIPHIRYSDKEGLAVRPGKTGVTGGNLKSVKEHYRQQFSAKFKQSAKDIIARIKPTQLVIISPIVSEVEALLPVSTKKLVRLRLRKNLCEQHPEHIFEHIAKAIAK